MGGDSACVAGLSITVRKDPKVFVKGEFVYGMCGSYRMGNLLRYTFKEPDHDPRVEVDTYMYNDWINGVRECFEKGGFMRKYYGEEHGGTFLVGYKQRLFCVDSDFQIGETALAYDAVGCGDDLAKGAMHSLMDVKLAPEKKVQKALEAAVEHSGGVRPPFTIIVLKDQ